MAKYQVWLRGSDLHDIDAESEQDAKQQVRDMYGYKRLPKDTCVCRIGANYYKDIVRWNQQAGFNATNM